MHITDRRHQILDNKKAIIQALFDKGNPSPIFIMGINQYCDHLLNYFAKKRIAVAGIIHDYKPTVRTYKAKPVYRMSEIPDKKNSIIVSCVIDGRIQTALRNLKRKGYRLYVNYLELCLYDEELAKVVPYCDRNVRDVNANGHKYAWLYDMLGDDLSKQTLSCVTDFRYNFNTDALKGFRMGLDLQYFDSIVTFGRGEVFVDCGGFDGRTTAGFIERNLDYRAIYYFEPVLSYYRDSLELLNGARDITFINKATYSENTVLRFSVSGSASRLSDDGGITVETTRLDDVINEKVTYIKMDVEGAEYDSLVGAESLIRRYKPKLAICVYHNQEHFWKIPELVLGFNPCYKVYLRHYTEGLLETVMYFL